jgi:hypothetical protein
MATLHKFADHVRGVNSKLAEVHATTESLSLADKQSLLETLSTEVAAAAQKQDGPRRRLESVRAASASTNPRTKDAYKTAIASLRALGGDLESIAQSGTVADLDEKMRQFKWDPTRKTALKVALAAIGAID